MWLPIKVQTISKWRLNLPHFTQLHIHPLHPTPYLLDRGRRENLKPITTTEGIYSMSISPLAGTLDLSIMRVRPLFLAYLDGFPVIRHRKIADIPTKIRY